MTQMTQANPQLWQVIGDQLVKNMDWPGAEEMAERLKLTLLPEVKAIATKDDKPGAIPPEAQMQMQQMQQHIQEMGQALNNASQQMDQVQGDAQKAKTDLMASRLDKEEARSKLGLEARKLAIEEYRAETERMVAEAAAGAKSHELEMQAIQAMQAAQQSADQQEQEAQDAQAPQEPDNTAALAQAMQGHATALQGLQKTIGNMSQPPPQQPAPAQPASAGFSLPEQQIPQ
jgi:chromosome segregation ATPase